MILQNFEPTEPSFIEKKKIKRFVIFRFHSIYRIDQYAMASFMFYLYLFYERVFFSQHDWCKNEIYTNIQNCLSFLRGF